MSVQETMEEMFYEANLARFCGARTKDGRRCRNPAGWGFGFRVGRCRLHRRASEIVHREAAVEHKVAP